MTMYPFWLIHPRIGTDVLEVPGPYVPPDIDPDAPDEPEPEPEPEEA